MKIKLRNGRVMEATVSPNGTYEVILASGKVKFYGESDILAIVDDEVVVEAESSESEAITDKEKKMDIYHYLQRLNGPDGEYTVRIVTTDLGNVAARYNESVATRHPVNNILAISTGAYTFSLLEWELIRNNKEFRLMIIGNADLAANYSSTKLNEMLDRSTFVHANASYSFFMRIKDGVEWGLDDFKLELDFKKKAAKRGQELYRLSDMAWHTFGPAKMDMALLDEDDLAGPEMFYDGMTFIRQRVAIKMALGCQHEKRRRTMIREIKSGQMVRIGFRYMTAGGMVKGDAIIVPDDQISRDVITHNCNIKGEFRTASGTHMTGWNHEPRHMAVWDDQSTINFGVALTEEKQKADISRLLLAMRESLEAGTLPEWLLLGEKDRDENGVPDMDKLSESINKQWIKWQAHGLDIRAAQNLVYMGLGGVVNRMKASPLMKSHALNETFYKKMWIPMTNAMLGAIVTWEACVDMGGFEFPGRSKDKMFYDPRVGLVICGKRFQETFDLHGTWDLDDTVKAIHIKVWASGDYSQHLGLTLAEGTKLPKSAGKAVDKLLLVRSPNGPGEYSIEDFDADGMFIEELVDPAQVVVVDMCNMPDPQPLLLESSIIQHMPTSTDYHGGEITKADALDMLTAQALNPGVGRFCNAIMVWAEAMGPSFPPMMLDVMGEIVDACQQGFDRTSFDAIGSEPDSIFDQLVVRAETTGIKLDHAIATTRLPAKYNNLLKDSLVVGRFTRVQRVYKTVVNAMVSELQYKSMQWRRESDFVQAIKPIKFGAEMAAWSQKFFAKHSTALQATDRQFKVDNSADPFTRMHLQYQHKLAMEECVAAMVAEIHNLGDDEVQDNYILGLYKWIVLFNHGRRVPLGLQDRIIFQSGGVGNMSLMDLLIEAAHRKDLV